jgi:uncharacterized membrane protein
MPEASLDTTTMVLFGIRWFHLIFGVLWIGLLYFFNFVNVPFAKTMDAATKKAVIPQLIPRALWWFRWAAMVTFITGWAYIGARQHLNGASMMGEDGLLSTTWGQWIGLGALLASYMWFNVWFIIWPSQKKLITWVKKGEAPTEMAAIAKKALVASRINCYLSAPMLFCMGAASHLPAFNLVYVLVAFGVGFLLVYHFIAQLSVKMGSNF